MKSTYFISTENGNYYYLDINKRISGYAHPLFAWLHNFEKQNNTFDKVPDTIMLEGIGHFDKETIQYYIKKHNFLKKYGLYSDRNQEIDLNYQLSPDVIEYQMANLVQLTFEITDACNLNCKYCAYNDFYNDHDKRENNYLSHEAAKKIIDYLAEKWNSSLNSSYKGLTYISFYGGEPLMNVPLIEKIINYVNSLNLNRSIKYSMTSNCLLLDKYEEFLVDNKIHLLISLDGNEYNNGYRVDHSGKSTFNKLYQNIKHLKDSYPSYFEEQVQFNAVLHNKNSVEEILSYIKNEFGKIPSIGELNGSGIRTEMIEEFNKTYKNYRSDIKKSEHYEELTNDLNVSSPDVKDFDIFLMIYCGIFFDSYDDLFIDCENTNINKRPTGTCLPFGKKMFVTVNGKILPCERIGHQFGLGSVTKDSVNLDLSSISDMYNNYFQKLRKQCGNCFQSHSCIQCIFNLPDIDELHTKCYGYTNENKFLKYLSEMFTFLEKKPEYYKDFIDNLVFQ